MIVRLARSASALFAVGFAVSVAGCTQTGEVLDSVATSALPQKHSAKERECLARAMFFESNRSSRDGLVAVGTVVMNRLDSGHYGETICGVVGAKNQFAPGVLSRPMNSTALPDVMAAADSVLAGERHPKVQHAQFFHQAGLRFPYDNMHYVLEAGGNAFYEKRSRGGIKAMVAAKTGRVQATDPVVGNEEEAPQLPSVAALTENMPVMSFDVTPNEADAIGAMLSSQMRPSN